MRDFLPETHSLLLLIARSLVDRPESVTVIAKENAIPPTFEIRVAASDIGKLIGKQGRTARSIRTVIAASAQAYRHPAVAIDIAAAPVL